VEAARLRGGRRDESRPGGIPRQSGRPAMTSLSAAPDGGASWSDVRPQGLHSPDIGGNVMALAVTRQGRLADDMQRGLLAGENEGKRLRLVAREPIMGPAVNPDDPMVGSGPGILRSSDRRESFTQVLHCRTVPAPSRGRKSGPTSATRLASIARCTGPAIRAEPGSRLHEEQAVSRESATTLAPSPRAPGTRDRGGHRTARPARAAHGGQGGRPTSRLPDRGRKDAACSRLRPSRSLGALRDMARRSSRCARERPYPRLSCAATRSL
jgi:hypothetical protein